MGTTETEGGYYAGPVCYAGPSSHDLYGQTCDPGWHYSAVVDQEAKDIAVAAAQAEVALWEKRADGVAGGLAGERFERAKEALAGVRAASFEVPDQKLVLEEDGRYRLATEADTDSWHERKHQSFATFELEDASEATRVNAEEYAAIQTMLKGMRGGEPPEGGGTQ